MWYHKRSWDTKAEELTCSYTYPLLQKEYGLKIRSHSRDERVTYIPSSVSARCAGTKTQMYILLWDHETEVFIRAVMKPAPRLENAESSASSEEAEL